jgi:putative phosphoribosyl transferase
MTVAPHPESPTLFPDRRTAGHTLAARLERLRAEAPVVVALSRSGVPVAHEIARSLGAPLDVLTIRRVGEPGHWVGAVAEDGTAVIDHDLARLYRLGAEELSELRERALADARAGARAKRAGREPLELVGRTVVLVDDGIAGGRTAEAGARAMRRRGAGRVVIATPVLSSRAVARLGDSVDEVVCLRFAGAGRWYAEPAHVTDAVVAAAMTGELREHGAPERVWIPLAGEASMPAEVTLPEAARGAVVVASAGPAVATALRHAGFATLSLDLPADGTAVRSLAVAAGWLRSRPVAERLGLGIYGAGHAAIAALRVAAADGLSAVVAAGAGPELAGVELGRIGAAALLIAGGEDRLALHMNRSARGRLGGESGLAVVAGAGPGLDEPGVDEQLAHLAVEWFARHL